MNRNYGIHFLAKDISHLERVQRRATKFICMDDSMGYQVRLISLQLMPLILWLEDQDVLLLVKCLKYLPNNFDLRDYTKILPELPLKEN